MSRKKSIINYEWWKASSGVYLIRRPTVDATVYYKRFEY